MYNKKELRTKAFQLRQKLIENNTYKILSHKIQENILASQIYIKSRQICLYSSVRGEVNTDYLAQNAFESNKIVFYPRCHQEEKGIMNYAKCESFTDLQLGKYNILEPKASCTTILTQELNNKETLILVPALFFDFHGIRLGYGQGYYDRILSKTPMATTIGLTYFEHIQNMLPKMEWDVAVKYLAHEFELIEITDFFSVN